MTQLQKEQNVTIAVCNKIGHLDDMNMLSDTNFLVVSETGSSNRITLDFHRRPICGLRLCGGGVPFWVPGNLPKREILQYGQLDGELVGRSSIK
jgi:hypothetical protein